MNNNFEIKQRFDGKFNLWRYMPDPTVDWRDYKYYGVMPWRWVVVGVFDTHSAALATLHRSK